MPPTRGHDLKHDAFYCIGQCTQDAPHTGARLETRPKAMPPTRGQMPPTRGHDLKQHLAHGVLAQVWMPPTRGHDLKLSPFRFLAVPRWMPPTRGHDLKPLTDLIVALQRQGCPPHGGTT